MIKILKYKFSIFLLVFLLFFSLNEESAKEILIYADNISYDKKENIIARGKAKIIYNNNIISSDLIIYSQQTGSINLPTQFSLKDEKNNYYYGSSGLIDSKFEFGDINDVKILLNEGSRIVGKSVKRRNNIDIITKAVYSPCKSRIKIANFICPIWEIQGEKILHDYNDLFLYQKHSKIKILNTPIFYTPYIVTPSPLRKDRKSGFLTPSINLNFFDTKISQSTSFPYYINLSVDKELTFTPTINYGGGVDSSQRFNFDYNQILSGGAFESNLTFDSSFENQNNEKWLKEGSLINVYKNNLNEKFNINITSALQTSKNYIQQTKPNDDLSYTSSLNSKIDINGFNVREIDDLLRINISFYQSNQNNENNKTIPTTLPYITYKFGKGYINNFENNNYIEFYNIFRDTPSGIHSKSQKKLSTTLSFKKNLIKYATKINISSNIYNQLFVVEDKKINNENVSNSYFRSFPIFGIDLQTPFKLKNNYKNLTYTPKLSFILTPGSSNSDKISNEDSSVNSFTINNNISLNRFTGSDKLDNSKRVNIGFDITNDVFESSLWQTYEFTNNSNFHYSQGNENHLSDLLGNIKFNKKNINSNYDFRFDQNENYMKSQNLEIKYENNIGDIKLSYLDLKNKTDDTIISDKETLNYNLVSKKINKYSKLSYFGLYDFKNSTNKETGIGYSYFDECFGINIDFKRNSYSEEDLKPKDILTIMFSFKNLGSYKSTNLAVSEYDKQDIKWESNRVDNELFN